MADSELPAYQHIVVAENHATTAQANELAQQQAALQNAAVSSLVQQGASSVNSLLRRGVSTADTLPVIATIRRWIQLAWGSSEEVANASGIPTLGLRLGVLGCAYALLGVAQKLIGWTRTGLWLTAAFVVLKPFVSTNIGRLMWKIITEGPDHLSSQEVAAVRD